ncbi:MAG: HD domain-containing phosphohydrolase [Halothermotrichaceae bacterium]
MKLKNENKIILFYLLIGLFWIAFSDRIVSLIAQSHDLHLIMQTYKGWAYVIITAVIFYIILHKAMDSMRKQKQKLQESYSQLEADNEEFQALNKEIIEKNDKLSAQQKQLREIIDLVPHLIFAKDEDSNFILVNQAVADLYNTQPENIIHSSHKNSIHTEISEEELDFFLKTDQQVLNNNNKIKIEEEQITDIDGNTRIYQTEKIPFNSYNSDKKALLGVAVDITKLKEQEKTIEKYHKMEQEKQQEIILSIIQMLEIHDTYTGGHSQNVGKLSKKIAEKLGLNDKKIKDTYWAGIVHDIGKILIPKKILNKKGQLSDFEYNIIKKHSRWGYQTLIKSNTLKKIAIYVLYHHERWDGKGYPEGITGEEIPLISQIICLADSWDAMSSTRSYRQALPHKKALSEIKNNRGKQFAPDIVDAFLEIQYSS